MRASKMQDWGVVWGQTDGTTDSEEGRKVQKV